MKYFALLILSFMFISCASDQHRKVSSDEPLTQKERMRQLNEFGGGYRN